MTLHTRVAMVFLAALPISTAFANVMMLTLVLAALLQGKAMRQVIASRLQTKFAMAAILFVAWNALSLLWSWGPGLGEPSSPPCTCEGYETGCDLPYMAGLV